jgi:hypothetical protein
MRGQAQCTNRPGSRSKSPDHNLATHLTARLITAALAAFALRWSLRGRGHRAAARWHHHSARLKVLTSTG